MKKIIPVILIIFILLLIAGCNNEKNEEGIPPAPDEADLSDSGTNSVEVPPAVEQSEKITEFFPENARERASEIFALLDLLHKGGNNSPGTIDIEGAYKNPHIYIDKEIATTMEGLEDYLSRYFTEEFIVTMIKGMQIIEHNDLLALPKYQAWISLDFDDAEIKLDHAGTDEIAYEFYFKQSEDHIINFTLLFRQDNNKILIHEIQSEPCPCCM